MKLEEAIKHCEEVAEENTKACDRNICFQNEYNNIECDECYIEGCNKCASEHKQLAEWLKELKYYKDRQNLINKSWQKLINYKEGIGKIKMRSQAYRERGETVLASGMEQALDILEAVNADEV